MTDDHRIQPGQPKQAAKTTIVGGQPPGNQRLLAEVPVGLEQLLAMAAASDDFAQALRERPDRAIAASGLTLTHTERAVLRAIPEPMLDKMIHRVASALPWPERRLFLERAAAALVVLLGAGALGACKGGKGTQSAAGSDPMDMAPGDLPRPMEAMREPPPPGPPAGIRPDPPRPADGGVKVTQPPVTQAGATVARPPSSGMEPMRSQVPQAGATIERPRLSGSAGVRVERPMVPESRPRPQGVPKSRGISHYRTRTRTGIRPGRGDDDP